MGRTKKKREDRQRGFGGGMLSTKGEEFPGSSSLEKGRREEREIEVTKERGARLKIEDSTSKGGRGVQKQFAKKKDYRQQSFAG